MRGVYAWTTLLLGLWAMSAQAAPVTLARDGKALTKIVIPAAATPSVKAAAEELLYHVEVAAGARLEVVIEGEGETAAPAVYLGPCRKTLEAGITTAGLKANGWRVRTIHGSLFIYGEDGPADPHNRVVQSVFSGSGDPFRIPKYSTYARTGTLFGVYALLEREMGVRWLWPGKLGEVIPHRTTLTVPEQNLTGAPRFAQKRWQSAYLARWDAGWKSPEVAQAFYRDEAVWLRRHRFAQEEAMVGAHAFADWWTRFGQTHPEWFAQMPDGKRGIDPRQRSSQTASHAIAMCVSNEALRRQLVEDWQKSGQRTLNAGENDVNGRCTCLACLALDQCDQSPEVRLAEARQAFAANEEDSRWRGWPLVLGSLSNRYAQFWLQVQQDARRVRPDAVVVGCAYANWVEPPRRTKLNEGVCVQIVAPFYFPFTDQRRADLRKLWEGWRATGCVLLDRPNYTLSGHNFPIFYARKLGADISWQTRHGMMGAMYDSLIGQYASQGPNHYVLARMLEHPELPVDRVLQEYYRAFGPAAEAVEAYFRHWESVSDSLTDDLLTRNPEGKFDYVNSFGTFYRAADSLFTSQAMAEGRAKLMRARAAAANDEMARARVIFLELGLRHAEMTLAVEAARREGERSGDMSRFVQALRELDQFRAAHETEGIANMFFLWNNETKGNKSGTWDRKLAASAPNGE